MTIDSIAKILGKKIITASTLSLVKAPGMLLRHYATRTKLRTNAVFLNPNEIGLNFGNNNLIIEGSLNLSADSNLQEAASNLYEYLYILDNYCQKNNIEVIAVAPIPQEGIGLAINDRLNRSAA